MASMTEIMNEGRAVRAIVGVLVDLESSASSQHFIDTGAYLPIEDLVTYAVELEANSVADQMPTDLTELMEFGAACIDRYLRVAQTGEEE